MQCCAAFRLVENKKKTPTLNGGEKGVVWIVLFSEVLLLDYNVSTILSPIVGLCENQPYCDTRENERLLAV